MNQEFDSKDIIYQNDQLLIFKDTEGGASLSEQLFCVLLHFYPNVTTLRSGLCCRNSVCRLSVCLSVVCNVGAPYSGG